MPRIDTSKAKDRSPTIARLVPALLCWYSKNARELPWRRTRDPYAIWVSEIMLQQTQVKTVLPYWECWMRELPTIQALATASSEKIHKLWEGLGYYTRVRNLQKAAQLIEERHARKFPECFDDVLALPGIGRYTAGAICSIAFNQPTPILDGNVIRVLTRVVGIDKDPKKKEANAQLWRLAKEFVRHAASSPVICRRRRKESHSISLSSQRLLESSPACSNLNQSLMELGALVCTPRNPRCEICPVKKLCVAFRENRAGELPNLGSRARTQARHFVAFVVERQGRFLVRQRPAGVVNAHLWEFPNVELNGSRFDLRATAWRALGFEPERPEPLWTLRHSITRYRIELQAYAANATRLPKPGQTKGRWLTLPELQTLAFPSAHKKVLLRLLVRNNAGKGNSNHGSIKTRAICTCVGKQSPA